jgi:hypothetical protein
MIWYRLPGASSLGLLSMLEHYQKRIEASRYLNIAGWLEVGWNERNIGSKTT